MSTQTRRVIKSSQAKSLHNTLKGFFYYQNSQTVENYLDSFQTLVSDTSYSDPRTLVVKFQRGL